MIAGDYNEATRVQMPAMVHLLRLGYEFIGKLKDTDVGVKFDKDTNILVPIFKEMFEKLNPDKKGDFQSILKDIISELDNDDIGKSFYKRLISVSPYRLIDFENIENNVFQFTAEFPCKNGEESFRPDITLFINGLPLVFIEVKKPNNKGGMVAESERMNKERFPNRKFRRFINITQFMIFSNNMEYDAEGGIVPIQGSFYCTSSRNKAVLNCFREENPKKEVIAPFINEFKYKEVDNKKEKEILSAFNSHILHTTTEYQTNLDINTPTNRIITSMCSKERILYLIRYGIVYFHSQKELDNGEIEIKDEKHIMRYPQLFASMKVTEKLDDGIKSGIIWHTQGSGKTALAYYLHDVLTNYYSKRNTVCKFYFIVDRLDLLTQAVNEFTYRGLTVKTVNSKDELMEQFDSTRMQAQENNSGDREIIVVNIQKFGSKDNKDDVTVELKSDYSTNLQRIFIVDEAHRGYSFDEIDADKHYILQGKYLKNLLNADDNAIKIALTGTPILRDEEESWRIFGNYIHTYYYDKSIQDGYTLKIMREDIETYYKEKLKEIYEKIEVLIGKKNIDKNQVLEHDNYVDELLRYIIKDLVEFRTIHNDDELGGMVVCQSSIQANKIYGHFDIIKKELYEKYKDNKYLNLKAGLILCDYEDKEIRKDIIKDFKDNYKIDILIVKNMLLTGFDANRLKRMYLGRIIKDHTLLQAITRVNRPFKDNHYGYVVDFADIKRNFEQTNAAYLKELDRFNEVGNELAGEAINTFNQVIEDKDELIKQLKDAKQVLFNYTKDDAEVFNNEINSIEDKEELLKLKRALTSIKDCFTIVNTFGDEELKGFVKKLEIRKLPLLLANVVRRIDYINTKETIENADATRLVINEAMKDIKFKFDNVGEDELKIIAGKEEELNETYSKVITEFTKNQDKEDIEYISLKEAFLQKLKEMNMKKLDTNEFENRKIYFNDVLKKLQDMKRKNELLAKKYNDDGKFLRVHKRIIEFNRERVKANKQPILSKYDDEIVELLNDVKRTIDQKVYDRNDILKIDAYFEKTVLGELSDKIYKMGIKETNDDIEFLKSRISKQYLDEYNQVYKAA